MSRSDGTFIMVATYPDELTARDDYESVKDAHAMGLVGSYDAAVVTKDATGKIHETKHETATRHGAWWGVAVPEVSDRSQVAAARAAYDAARTRQRVIS